MFKDIPPLTKYQHVRVLRGDKISGGLKRPVLEKILPHIAEDIIGYPADGKGSAGEALALACKAVHKKLHLLLPEGPLPNTETFKKSINFGHVSFEIILNTHSQVDLVLANDAWVNKNNGYSMPIGCRTIDFNEGMQRYILDIWEHHQLPHDAEVWYAAGSGTLGKAIRTALPRCQLGIANLGFPQLDLGNEAVKIFNATTPNKPELPFPVNPDYDARIWPKVLEHASPGAIIINYA